MDWLARSPDLNPIDILYRRISQGDHPPMTFSRTHKHPKTWEFKIWFVACLGDARSVVLLEVVIHITDRKKWLIYVCLWHLKYGDFYNIYANSSLTGYRPWFANWLPMFAINMLQIKLFIFLNRCFIIIFQHLYTMRKYVFAP